MSVLQDDLVFYASVNMPEDDVSTAGGGIDKTVRVSFTDIAPAGNCQVVSSDAGDTTQTVTVTGRDSSGVEISEAIALNGVTPVAASTETDWERILKAVKSAATVGDVAVEEATAERANTAQGGAAKTVSEMAFITLDASASGSDDAYNGMVLRTTGGTGPNQVRKILDYRGSDNRAWVSEDWDVVPDATTTFRISQGMVLPKQPTECLSMVRPFIGAVADSASGSERRYYAKIFVENEHATLALTGATIAEADDPSGRFAFGVAGTLDDTATTTNRRTAPGGITFDSATKNVANSQNHSPGAGQGVWVELVLPAGAAALDTTYTLREDGAST